MSRTLVLAASFAVLVATSPQVVAADGAESTSGARSMLSVPERGSIIAGPTLSRIQTGPFTTSKRIEPALLADVLASAGESLATAAGKPRCTITTYSLRYQTVGGGGEATEASTALIVPSGADSACQGPRPVLLYAHGTSTAKDHNMARLRGEARLVAALFTAQGYIVVAPNYAGYEGSTLPYHPYLNAEQQSSDMVDALRAARTAMGKLKVQPSKHLFLAGYSQGGFVTLATQRAMQQQYGEEFQVSAAAGLSGPYALAQFSDRVFSGHPNAGITIYLPLIATSAQRAGAAIYASPGDLYESQYANGIETLLPGAMTRGDLFKRGKLPNRAVFASDSQPQGAGAGAYFAQQNLVRTSFRDAYLQDMASHPCDGAPNAACGADNNLRKWMLKNDLRNYVPQSPLLLCGGAGDPSVPFFNATAAASYFSAQGAAPVLVDLEQQSLQDAYTSVRLTFATMRDMALQKAQAEAVKTGRAAEDVVAESYHARLAGAPCLLAARTFFNAAMR